MDLSLPFNLDIWLSDFLPEIQRLLDIPNDDQEVVNYWYKRGLRSAPLNLDFLSGKEKILCFGAGPSLIKYDKFVQTIDQDTIAICSADGSTRWLLELGITPNFVTTDLDGLDIASIDKLLDMDVNIQILTHGDNYKKVNELLTTINTNKIEKLTFSTQGKPILGWHNTLGFTDGDRLLCALVAEGIPILCLGYDLSAQKIGKYSKPNFTQNMPMNERKHTKLIIAQQILRWVGHHYTYYLPSGTFSYAVTVDPIEFLKL